MRRLTGRPYEGLLTGWHYPQARAWRRLSADDPKVAAVADDPLCRAVLAVYADLRRGANLPAGPRAIGYALMGRTVAGAPVVKDKDREADALGLVRGSAARRAWCKAVLDFADVAEAIVSLRLAGLLDDEDVADDRSADWTPYTLTSRADLLADLRHAVRQSRPDVLAALGIHAELWTEAAALGPFLARLAEPAGVAVYSGSGDVPRAAIVAGGRRIADAWAAGYPVRIGIVGDYDHDGLANADAMAQRLMAEALDHASADGTAPAPGSLSFVWLGPPEDAQRRWPDLAGIGPAVTKAGRSLAFTAQAEALLPGGQLRAIVTDWLDATLPPERRAEAEARWEAVRSAVRARLAG